MTILIILLIVNFKPYMLGLFRVALMQSAGAWDTSVSVNVKEHKSLHSVDFSVHSTCNNTIAILKFRLTQVIYCTACVYS